MGRKWLDNYGQEDNYNDSKVSLPKGFVGDGIINGHQWNSPAWGGQFQIGGSLPGTSGIMYSRESSNKPIIKVAQDGTNVDYSKLPYDENDIKGFYNKMISSPWYKNRLIKNGYDDQYSIGVDGVIKNRLKRVNNAKLDNIQKNDGVLNQMYRFITSGELIETGSGSYYNPDTGNITMVGSQMNKHKAHPRTILSHEYGHPEVQGGISRIEEEMLSQFNPTPIKKLTEHDKKPSENKSDINSLRYNLYKAKIFDPSTGNYKTKSKKFEQSLFEKVKDDASVKRLRNNYGDKQLIKLINTVATNENNNIIPIAENGVIKDNNGYWNPDNWGKVVEIDSNDITMQGVNQPLLGISDEGDIQYMEPNKDYKFKGKKVREFPIAQNGRNLKRLLNENIKKDSNVYLNYTKKQNINPRREIRKEVDAIQTIQNKYNVSREKAAEIKQKLEIEKVIKNPPKNPYEIKPGEDQSFLSKSWEVLTNPATAASYWLNDQRIPDRFSKGERNNLDIATDLFNPFGIINSGKNAVKETISLPKNLYNGEYGEAGSNFLNAGLNALSVMPALRELKGLKPIEIPKQLPDFGNVDDVGSMFKGHLTDKEKEMYRWFEKQQKLDALPNTKNKKTLGVLEDFKTRIQTPEGKKRMKELGIDSDEMLQKIQIVEDPNTFGYFSGNRNKVVLNPSDPLSTHTARHEIEHGVQNALKQNKINKAVNLLPTEKLKSLDFGKSNIDDLLSDLELRKQGTPNKQWIGHVDNDSPVNVSEYKSLLSNKQNATDYFLTGSDGREKSAFLGEVQQYMMDNNIIPKTSYKEVTPEMVKNVFVDAMFDEAGGGKYLRLFNIMNPTQKNYELVAKGLNKMLTVTGTIGVGAASQIEQKKEGGIIKDNNGYWNPIARNGINNLDENSLQQLDQLTNFTNYNKLSNGGWLDKF